jgi:hypothetical protein
MLTICQCWQHCSVLQRCWHSDSIVHVRLHAAAVQASSSLTRGPATCLTCKGVGACECPLCKVSSSQAPAHLCSSAAQNARGLLGSTPSTTAALPSAVGPLV